MKDIILDTDIGGDCDDAGALVMLKTMAEKKEINLLAITSCTTMEGAEHCITSIMDYYHMSVPVGVMTSPPFMCSDDFNIYARKIKQEFNCKPNTVDAVKLLRKTIAGAENKITFIAIGPQRNLKNLLLSSADEFSPLTGEELVREKIDELVIMGGCFLNKTQKVYYQNEKEIDIEWNIEQDAEAAIYVSKKWDTEIVYSPFELGHEILTGRNLPENSPAKRCYEIRCGGLRESWDPCAAYYGARGCDSIFTLSDFGRVTIDKKGNSKFTADKGKHRVLLATATNTQIENKLDEIMS